MLKSAFVALVAGAVLLKIAARRDPFGVEDVQELTVVSLFTLILHPVHAHSPFSLAFIDMLFLRLENRLELVSTSDK